MVSNFSKSSQAWKDRLKHWAVGDEPAPKPSDCRKLVLIFHDEVAYHSNDDQKWMWAKNGKQPIRLKGQGRGIMVSDYI